MPFDACPVGASVSLHIPSLSDSNQLAAFTQSRKLVCVLMGPRNSFGVLTSPLILKSGRHE
jgi:hypothetical protein